MFVDTKAVIICSVVLANLVICLEINEEKIYMPGDTLELTCEAPSEVLPVPITTAQWFAQDGVYERILLTIGGELSLDLENSTLGQRVSVVQSYNSDYQWNMWVLTISNMTYSDTALYVCDLRNNTNAVVYSYKVNVSVADLVPTTAADQPTTAVDGPTITTDQPSTTVDQPSTTADQPSTTAHQPSITAQQSTPEDNKEGESSTTYPSRVISEYVNPYVLTHTPEEY